MNLTRTMADLGDLYLEKVSTPTDTFETNTDKTVKSKKDKENPFISDKKGLKSGPENAEGVKKDAVDPKTAKEDNFYQPAKFSQKQQNSKKIAKESINNFMNKSIFDELYEAVMDEQGIDTETHDAEALGLPGDESHGEEGGDEVTITLSKELASKLHEALMAVVGSEEEPSEGEDHDELGDESSDEEDEQTFGEATDIKELGDKGSALKGKNNKVSSTVTSDVDSSEGDGDSSGEVDGGKPKAAKKVVGGGVPSNKVASKVTSSVGKDIFAAARK